VRAVYKAVYTNTAMYTTVTAVYTDRVHGRVQGRLHLHHRVHGLVHGRVHGHGPSPEHCIRPCTLIRPCTRHGRVRAVCTAVLSGRVDGRRPPPYTYTCTFDTDIAIFIQRTTIKVKQPNNRLIVTGNVVNVGFW